MVLELKTYQISGIEHLKNCARATSGAVSLPCVLFTFLLAFVGCEAFAMVTLKSCIFWDVKLYDPVQVV
jgi:hypothetical protein